MNPHSEFGQTDRDGATVSSRVLDYLKAAGVDHPETAPAPYWGGAFLAWLAIRQGVLPPVNPLDADSWLSWGQPAATPAPGCVVIMTSGGGHSAHLVGLVERVTGDKVYVTKGDCNGQVGTQAYPMSQVIGCRKPPVSTHVPVSTAQALTLTIDHQGLPSVPSAPLTIDHAPATTDDILRQQVYELRQTVAAMQEQIHGFRHTLETLEITPLDDHGHAIPWSDFVRRSQLSTGT